MPLDATTLFEPSFAEIDGLPPVDLSANLIHAQSAGRRVSGVLAELFSLMRGPGRMTPAEYFYYRLWDPALTRDEKRCFVGKRAQVTMHHACNDEAFRAAADDKLRFHELMTAYGLPVPKLLAVAHRERRITGVPSLSDRESVAGFLERAGAFPLFAKPIDGKYSLNVISADGLDPAGDVVALRGVPPAARKALAGRIAGYEPGYLLQRRLAPHPEIADVFGDRLWSVRIVVLLTNEGPQVHRAAAKVPTGANPADNYWRPGNLLAAVDLGSGELRRVVCGSGADLAVNPDHPNTGAPIVAFRLPEWRRALDLVRAASVLVPGIRTQSWDLALAPEPTLLEVNWGGDLNLPQLAWGQGVLDESYRAHLASCGYRARS